MSREAARRWRDTWARAWRAHDADAVELLYADDAVFTSEPFREPHQGAAGARAYAEWAFSSEEAVECWFGEPVVDGDRATCEYWAVVREAGGEQTLAGCAVIRFGPEGKVVEQRDYWNVHEGRRVEPASGWGH